MIYLWDTDTCIYHLNGHARITEKIRNVGAASIATTMITIAELEFGAYNSMRVEENLQKIDALQRTMMVLSDFNSAIARRFAENKAALRKSGISVGDFDLFTSYAVETLLPDFQIRKIDMIIKNMQTVEQNPEG